MSKHETPLTEHFWTCCCPGTFIPEYKLVRKTKDQARRLVDAVILPNESHCRASYADFPSLIGHDVVVVQTKASRLGMYVMGQAVFSARLAMSVGARSVRSVILVTKSDEALLPLLESFPEVEVWIADPGLAREPTKVSTNMKAVIDAAT